MTAGLAIAGDKVSADQILNALQPKKPLTRGLSAGPQADPAIKAREIQFVDTLRNRKTRSLSLGEREEIAELAATKPKIDLEIQFDYNRPTSARPRCRRRRSSARRSRIQPEGLDLRRRRPHGRDRQRALQPGPLRAPRRHHQAVSHREIRHQRRRSRHRRLWREQAEGYERADGPDEPPRSGRQHGYQDRSKYDR